VVTFIQTAQGLVAVIMVGATNVGRISLAYTTFETNQSPWRRRSVSVIEHAGELDVKRGQKIGTFKMGSSVIIVTEARLATALPTDLPRAVQYGKPLGGSVDQG
jgi:phosphatidylserine decarboxylase